MKMTFKIILIGGLIVFFAVVTVVVFTPAVVWKPAQTVVGDQRTADQEKGRVLFYSNGCNYCHTQYVRDVDNAMGPTSDGGDYALDNPMILGSERTGPDLSYIGRKRSMQWEVDHLRAPREYSPMSIMPSFSFLGDTDLRTISEYLFHLGDRTAAERMIASPAPYATTKAPEMAQALPSNDPSLPPQGWPTFVASTLYDGKLLYTARCLTCHGCAGNGLGHYAGTLIVTPANFKEEPFRDMPDDQWFWHVSEGVQGAVMPPWRESLTVAQRWAVIRYVQQVYAHPFERDPAEGDPPPAYDKKNPLPATLDNIQAGKETWTRECLPCHGDAATGEGPYRRNIEPVPPSFTDKSHYDPFTDGDYFWRISEGVPWTAMPTWKVQYTETQRWQLVVYIRTMFTQTTKRPPDPPKSQRFSYPAIYTTLHLPAGATYEAGKKQFLVLCSHCHGLTGAGNGQAGSYLNPKPKDLRKLRTEIKSGLGSDNPEGSLLSRITFGIRNSAMPAWGEFLPEHERWTDVRFVKESFIDGKPTPASVMGDGKVPNPYVRTDSGIFQSEIATISPDAGKPLYDLYCRACHGDDGLGNGRDTKTLASGGPAAFPKTMSDAYIFYRIRAGAPDTMMYGFDPLLQEIDIWNLTAYIRQLTGGTWGG
jgi:cbb3-type cytochrome c oxidase subunit II